MARVRQRAASTPQQKSSQVNATEAEKSATIRKPYAWATNQRAIVQSLDFLIDNGITSITGNVECKKCERRYEISYALQEKFNEVANFIIGNMNDMNNRAPDCWMNPTLPDCKFCNQRNSVKPVITKKKSINWLFLLLGQMIGCCKLSELKYFCKHTNNHRTGAKNRLVYCAYLVLCRQLIPHGPF